MNMTTCRTVMHLRHRTARFCHHLGSWVLRVIPLERLMADDKRPSRSADGADVGKPGDRTARESGTMRSVSPLIERGM